MTGSSFCPAKMRETIENDVIGASPSLHSKWGQGWRGTYDVIFDCYPLLSPPLPSPLSTPSPRTRQDSWVQSIMGRPYITTYVTQVISNLISDFQFLISDFWFPISDFRFPNSDFWLLIADCWLLIADCWLLIADCWLLISDFWFLISDFWFLISDFWVSDFWFLISDFWFRISGFGFQTDFGF